MTTFSDSDRQSTRVMRPPGGSSTLHFSTEEDDVEQQMAGELRPDRQASAMRNKSSIFEDGPAAVSPRRGGPRPADRSSDNIFGSVTESRGPVKDHFKSNVFAEPESRKGPVKDYQKSSIFSEPEHNTRKVKDYQKSNLFSEDLPAAGAPSGPLAAGRRSAGEFRPRSAYNPITGQGDPGGAADQTDHYHTSRRSAQRGPQVNPLMGGSDLPTSARPARCDSPLAVNRQRNREGTHNPITGVAYGPENGAKEQKGDEADKSCEEPQEEVGDPQQNGKEEEVEEEEAAPPSPKEESPRAAPPAVKAPEPQPQSPVKHVHHRVTQPPGGISHGLW